MYRTLLTATGVAMILGTATAQDWRDDFLDGSAVDGSPVSWAASPAFPSAFNVIADNLVMTMPNGAAQPITSARVPINFESGASVRARIIGHNAPGRYAIALADEPTGIKGYVASFTTCNGGTLELFRGDVPGAIVFLGGGPLAWDYSPLEEHYIQLDVLDGVVSVRVWRPGEPFPEPQISATDTTYTQGVVSVAIQDFGSHASGCQAPGGNLSDVSATVRFVHASDTPLTHSGEADITADGVVGLDDLLGVIGAWGPCPRSCSADINGDLSVNLPDLLSVISNWG